MHAQNWHDYQRLAEAELSPIQSRPDAMAEYAAIERNSKSAAS
jgi:hypothetical protein